MVPLIEIFLIKHINKDFKTTMILKTLQLKSFTVTTSKLYHKPQWESQSKNSSEVKKWLTRPIKKERESNLRSTQSQRKCQIHKRDKACRKKDPDMCYKCRMEFIRRGSNGCTKISIIKFMCYTIRKNSQSYMKSRESF